MKGSTSFWSPRLVCSLRSAHSSPSQDSTKPLRTGAKSPASAEAYRVHCSTMTHASLEHLVHVLGSVVLPWLPVGCLLKVLSLAYHECHSILFCGLHLDPLTWPLLAKHEETHYELAQHICLFPEVLREHLENRRTKLLNIRRDDVSKPMALLDRVHSRVSSLLLLELSERSCELACI